MLIWITVQLTHKSTPSCMSHSSPNRSYSWKTSDTEVQTDCIWTEHLPQQKQHLKTSWNVIASSYGDRLLAAFLKFIPACPVYSSTFSTALISKDKTKLCYFLKPPCKIHNLFLTRVSHPEPARPDPRCNWSAAEASECHYPEMRSFNWVAYD